MITLYDSTGKKLYDLDVTDESYSNKSIMSDDQLTLNFSSTDYYDIPVGAYCSFGGTKYTLLSEANFTKHGTRNFEYTLVLDVDGANLKGWMVRDSDGRLSFSYTGKPAEILQFLVDNCNRHTTGWTVGNCIDDDDITMTFSHTYISDALKQLADTEQTEYEIIGKTISLWKIKYNTDSPIELQYGEGNALKVDVKREKTDTKIDVLLPETSDRNIDYSKTGHKELILPIAQTLGYDGTHFDNETGYDSTKARTYKSSNDGYSVMRSDSTNTNGHEDSLDCTKIYPSRLGTISSVVEVDRNGHLYDIVDSAIPDNLDFSQYIIDGDHMTIVFQSGMLAGKEFDAAYYHTAIGQKAAKRFEIVPQAFDGITMPDYGTGYLPSAGDKYIVFGIQLPDAYICDNATKTGASWDVFRKCAKYMFDHEDKKFTFSGSINPVWAHRHWNNVGGKFVLGGYAQVIDEQFLPDGSPVRITAIKQYVNHPYRPEITLSNDVTGGTATTAIRKAENQKVTIDESSKESVRYTNRRFRDAQETISMLSAAIDNFGTAINPISVQTMALLVGDESLQFRFVDNMTTPNEISHAITYNADTKILHSDAGILQHMTLGITSLSDSHSASEYKFWTMSAFDSASLDDGTVSYYLYAKCSKTASTGTFILSSTAIKMEQVDGYYHLLIGVLNSEYNSTRSFVTLYGFSEILPGRMTADKIISSDGTQFIDWVKKAFRIGDSDSFIDYNTSNDKKLKFKGALVQSPSGDEATIATFRGTYSQVATYFLGDEVTYSIDNSTSTYRYINNASSVGKIPGTDTDYWKIVAQGNSSYLHVAYSTAADGSTGFSTTDPTGKTYIGTYSDSNEADSTDPTKYTWVLIKGEKGETGSAGNGISSHSVTYQKSISGTDVPTGTWLSSIPSLNAGEYLWTKTTLVFADSASTTAYSVSMKGETGGIGETGPTGKGISSTAITYQESASGTTVPTGTWLTSIPSVPAGSYLWTRTIITYTDSTTDTGYSVSKMGETGAQGNYTEYRYAANDSPSTPPEIVVTDSIPTGWAIAMPALGLYQYMWVTSAQKTSTGVLVGQWSTPQRFTGINGPALSPAGLWSANGVYYGTSVLVSVVKYNNVFYIARYDVGSTFTSSTTPDNDTTHWQTLGANFTSIATGLLLAQEAYIENLIVSRLATSSNPYAFMLATLDAALGIFRNKADSASISNALIALGKDISEMQLSGQRKPAIAVRDVQWRGDYDGSTIYYKDDRVYYATNNTTYLFTHDWLATETPAAGLLPTNYNYWEPIGSGNLGGGSYSEFGSEGLFSNGSNVQGVPFLGTYDNFTSAMLLTKRNSDSSGMSAAVLGVDNTGDSDTINASKSYGGYFNRLYIQSELDNIFVTSDSTNMTLDKSGYHTIHYYGSSDKNVYLPAVNSRDVGLKFWFRKINTGNMFVGADSGHSIINQNGDSVVRVGVEHNSLCMVIWDGSYWIFNFMN